MSSSEELFKTMRFFAENPMARISEEDQINACWRDAGSEARIHIDAVGIGFVYGPLVQSRIVQGDL